MFYNRKFHILAMLGILGILLPLGFELSSSIYISLGFGASFSLIHMNWKALKKQDSN